MKISGANQKYLAKSENISGWNRKYLAKTANAVELILSGQSLFGGQRKKSPKNYQLHTVIKTFIQRPS